MGLVQMLFVVAGAVAMAAGGDFTARGSAGLWIARPDEFRKVADSLMLAQARWRCERQGSRPQFIRYLRVEHNPFRCTVTGLFRCLEK